MKAKIFPHIVPMERRQERIPETRYRGDRMHIIARCPRCGYRWWLAADAADRRMRCRKCLTLLKVPDFTEVPDATKIITQAASNLYVDDTGRTYG